MTPKKTLSHGGNLQEACQTFGIEKDHWIDLSTGINPLSYPLDTLPEAAFQELPYLNEAFYSAVQRYYGQHSFIPLSGSQEMIQTLPERLTSFPIMLPSVGYQEHHQAWLSHGNICHYYNAFNAEQAVQQIGQALEENPRQHILVINPNNPSGLRFSSHQLRQWAKRMATGALLIVDEAFIDITPEQSVLAENLPQNILVLRSFGKFFGLAGLRLGFAFAKEGLLAQLQAKSNPWPLNGPALFLATQAFKDHTWQQQMRDHIATLSSDTQALLKPLLELSPQSQLIAKCHLFNSYLCDRSFGLEIYEKFAQAGILLRLIDVDPQQVLLRIGIFDSNHQEHLARIQTCISEALSE